MMTEQLKMAYQMSTGVWVIAECERCGRGFITVSADRIDRYLPAVGSRVTFSSAPCGGRIVMLAENPEHAVAVQTQHD